MAMMDQETLAMPTRPVADAPTGRAGAWLPRLAGAGWRLAFGLVLLCFFLPFFTVSCQGQPIASVRGVDLVTGATLAPLTARDQPVGAEQRVTVPREVGALVAAAAALGGLAAGLVRLRGARVLAGVAAALGLVALLLLREQALRLASSRTSVGVTVTPEAGYWLALAGFLLAGLLALAPPAVGWARQIRAVSTARSFMGRGTRAEAAGISDERSPG
jgi:hypothetical protein